MDKSNPISTAKPLTLIEPVSGWQFISWRELWQYRDLLYFMAWRNITVRYKQTILGAFWAIVQPFTTMVVFSIFLREKNSPESKALEAGHDETGA